MSDMPDRIWAFVHRTWGTTWSARPRRSTEAARINEVEYISVSWLKEQIEEVRMEIEGLRTTGFNHALDEVIRLIDESEGVEG